MIKCRSKPRTEAKAPRNESGEQSHNVWLPSCHGEATEQAFPSNVQALPIGIIDDTEGERVHPHHMGEVDAFQDALSWDGPPKTRTKATHSVGLVVDHVRRRRHGEKRLQEGRLVLRVEEPKDEWERFRVWKG